MYDKDDFCKLQRVPGFPIRHPVVVDGYLLPDDPVYLLRNNRSHVDSVLMGFTKDEGIYLLGKTLSEYACNRPDIFLCNIIIYLRKKKMALVSQDALAFDW